MRVQQLLEHHGIAVNPFAEEDAQSDPVFKERCRDATYHPVWDKVYGDPADPATSIVFGEKGAGKTAMRMQMTGRIAAPQLASRTPAGCIVIRVRRLQSVPRPLRRSAQRPQAARPGPRARRVEAVGPHGRDPVARRHESGRPPARSVPHPSGPAANQINADRLKTLDRQQKRDLLLLAACYDNSLAESALVALEAAAAQARLLHLAQRLGPLARPGRDGGRRRRRSSTSASGAGCTTLWPYLIVVAGWLPWLARFAKWHLVARRIAKQRPRAQAARPASLRRILMRFPPRDIDGQPLPDNQRTDDRYELLDQVPGRAEVARQRRHDRAGRPRRRAAPDHRLGRADAGPHLADARQQVPQAARLRPENAAARASWSAYMEKEDRDFYQRARLDKQNMIPSLEWTGESLYDLANARVRTLRRRAAKQPKLRDLIDDSITDQRLIESFRTLRVPRHLFKFLYRLLVAHCHAHTDDNPRWKVAPETFEATLAVYRRDQDAADRGLQVG